MQLATILEKNATVFLANDNPASLVEHAIETGNHSPVAVPPYRMSPLRKEILRKEINKMLEEGIIAESKSPWAAPVVLVPKRTAI